jgi:hypothetical protein
VDGTDVATPTSGTSTDGPPVPTDGFTTDHATPVDGATPTDAPTANGTEGAAPNTDGETSTTRGHGYSPGGSYGGSDYGSNSGSDSPPPPNGDTKASGTESNAHNTSATDNSTNTDSESATDGGNGVSALVPSALLLFGAVAGLLVL